MKLKLISNSKIAAARVHPMVYWNGGPPAPDDASDPDDVEAAAAYAARLAEFFEQLTLTMSPIHAKKWVAMSDDEFSTLIHRSPWFCERMNAVVEEKMAELTFASLQRAIGHTVLDDTTGKPKTDASGAFIRKGASDVAMKMFMEQGIVEASREVQHQSGQPGEQPDFNNLNREDHRQMQVAECRRALLSLQPQVDAGDRQAIDTMVKVQDRLAKLLGTDQPRLIANFNTDASVHRLTDAELEYFIRQGLEEERREGKLVLVKRADGSEVYEAPEAD